MALIEQQRRVSAATVNSIAASDQLTISSVQRWDVSQMPKQYLKMNEGKGGRKTVFAVPRVLSGSATLQTLPQHSERVHD